jgi:hypothetical protein
VRIGLLGLLLRLIAGTGAARRANRATDDRARRSGHRAADRSASEATGHATGTGAGLVVAL